MAETRVVNLEVKDNSEETAKNFNKVADSIENVEKGIDGIGKRFV